jgi:hypothetical protein
MNILDILHVVEDDLRLDWVGELTDSGVEAIEAYLGKHRAFLSYLDDAAPTNNQR